MPFQFSEQQVADYHRSTFDLLDYLQNVIDNNFFTGVQSILDVGCGDGKIVAFLAKKLPTIHFVGCDVSPSMIAFASSYYPSEEYPNLRFVEKDACQLGFQATFDRVISFNCLHWVKNQKTVMQEIYNSLKPGGKAFLVASPKGSDDDLQTICKKVIFSFRWLFHFFNFKSNHSFHSKKEYEKIMDKIQFSIEKMEQRRRKAVFKNREALEVLLKAVLTPLYHLRPEKRAPFLDEVFAQLVKRGNVDASGAIDLHISQIEILLTRNF